VVSNVLQTVIVQSVWWQNHWMSR